MAVVILLANPLTGAPEARTQARRSPARQPSIDAPPVERHVQRILVRRAPSLHDQELFREGHLRRWQAQDAHSTGMTAAGVTLSLAGMTLWILGDVAAFGAWVGSRDCNRRCDPNDAYCECANWGGLALVVMLPPAALALFIGAPLLAAGITRSYLADHPSEAPRLRKVGMILGLSGLGVLLAGGLTFIGAARNTELVAYCASNLVLLGSVLGLTGLGIWAEARRAAALQREHRIDVSQKRKIAMDREVWAHENERLRAGLPRTHIWTYTLRF